MMKRTVALAAAILLLGCGTPEPEPEPDWDEIDRQLESIDRVLENCLETSPVLRHEMCYNRALWAVEDVAREHGVELD